MTPPAEYANYLSFLGFSDIQEPYVILAGTKVFRFHPAGQEIPDAAFSWESITWALEAGLLLRGTPKLEEVKNLIEGLERECGIWLEGFQTKEVWGRKK